ncbi:O-antigen ligase domain-containing protein [Cohnella zeiphila]|uniref:O-antigen ligase domain-containing protein n=1 Tax=Cohnella zeiphila TaxID=2761120 RepID=A0A7X0W0J0_9BACL|nr:O-antigen ligase domain-containing protein [Cohnella zeiphila]MBB6735113.1 O-antigen ligase domain-containing protein [Cohnella zeiphila]
MPGRAMGSDAVNKTIVALFLCSLAVFTYDSLPYFQFSVYRPLAMFPMFAASVLLLFTDFRFRRGDSLLMLFAAYSVGHSLLASIGNGDTGSSIKHTVTLLFGLSIYRVTVYVGKLAKEDGELRRRIVQCLLIGFIPPLAAGLLQAADAYLLHSGFSGTVTGLFSEKVYRGRIQMLSGEPSWAGIHLLSGGLLLLYLYGKGFRKQLLLPLSGVGLLLVISFSAYAYSVLLLALLVYVFVANKYRGRMLLALGAIVLVVAVGVPYLLQTLHVSGYFTDRFQFNFNHLLKADNSVFIRVVFPAIGFLEFAQHPIFGVGGGFYYRDFANLLLQHFDYGMKFSEVRDLVNLHPEMVTSRNLWSKLFAEEGMIGVILFFGFMASALRSSRAAPFAQFAFALCVSLVMNFDSYSFVDFWLLIGFIRCGFFEGWQAGQAERQETQDGKEWQRTA